MIKAAALRKIVFFMILEGLIVIERKVNGLFIFLELPVPEWLKSIDKRRNSCLPEA
jgi:hypothetical protein